MYVQYMCILLYVKSYVGVMVFIDVLSIGVWG